MFELLLLLALLLRVKASLNGDELGRLLGLLLLFAEGALALQNGVCVLLGGVLLLLEPLLLNLGSAELVEEELIEVRGTARRVGCLRPVSRIVAPIGVGVLALRLAVVL